jgi:large exoprotein involved in heme utilization and adhesion
MISGQGDYGTAIYTWVESSGSGNGGNLMIMADTLTLQEGGRVQAETRGNGMGSRVDLDVNTLQLMDGGAICVGSTSSGLSGDLNIHTDKSVNLSGAMVLGEDKSESGSCIYAYAPNAAGLDSSQIDIVSTTLNLADGGLIFSVTMEDGQAADINIQASESVTISGFRSYFSSSISSITSGSGDAGDIKINTQTLTLADTGRIQAWSDGSGEAGDIDLNVSSLILQDSGNISAAALDQGNAGDIDIACSTLTLDGNDTYINTDTSGSGNGGNIQMDVERLTLTNGAQVDASATGTGHAGSITIQTDDSISLHSSSITTESLDADGGNITLNTVDHLYLLDSQITTSVQGGSGNGGNIDIDPCFVVLNDSRIIANAFEGNGGNIHIVSDYFLAGPESTVMASSQLGIDGTVQIDSPDTDISGRLSSLKTPDLDVTGLLHTSCALKTMDRSSSLIVTGRGGLLSTPDDVMSIVYFDDASEEELVK